MKHRIFVFTATALLVIAAIANSGAQEPGGPQPQVNRKDTRAGDHSENGRMQKGGTG